MTMNEKDKKLSVMEKFFAEFVRIGEKYNYGFGSNELEIKLLSKEKGQK